MCALCQKFRESNVFTKEVTKWSIWRNIFWSENLCFFQHHSALFCLLVWFFQKIRKIEIKNWPQKLTFSPSLQSTDINSTIFYVRNHSQCLLCCYKVSESLVFSKFAFFPLLPCFTFLPLYSKPAVYCGKYWWNMKIY